jgi:hypothetical protein
VIERSKDTVISTKVRLGMMRTASALGMTLPLRSEIACPKLPCLRDRGELADRDHIEVS